MKKVYIIHGFAGVPNGGWLPWLMVELGKRDIFACALPMPNSSEPVATEWVDFMNYVIGEPNEDIYIVGHSLGGPAVFRYLESLKEDSKIGGVLLVAPFFEPLDKENLNSGYRKIDNFLLPEVNFEKIKNIPNKAIVIHGKKDNIVPFSQSEKIVSKTNWELVPVEDGYHFSQKSEPIYHELPQALDSILKILNDGK